MRADGWRTRLRYRLRRHGLTVLQVLMVPVDGLSDVLDRLILRLSGREVRIDSYGIHVAAPTEAEAVEQFLREDLRRASAPPSTGSFE